MSDRKGCIWGPDPYLARCIPFGLTTPLREVILAEHETIVYRGRVRGTHVLLVALAAIRAESPGVSGTRRES